MLFFVTDNLTCHTWVIEAKSIASAKSKWLARASRDINKVMPIGASTDYSLTRAEDLRDRRDWLKLFKFKIIKSGCYYIGDK